MAGSMFISPVISSSILWSHIGYRAANLLCFTSDLSLPSSFSSVSPIVALGLVTNRFYTNIAENNSDANGPVGADICTVDNRVGECSFNSPH